MSDNALASEEAAVREALLLYLLTVKEFYSKLYTPNITTRMETLFPYERISKSDEPKPVKLARAEKWWLKELFACLTTIKQTMDNLDRWRFWFLTLIENLEFTKDKIMVLTKGPDEVLREIKSHKMDEGYVRLIVNNTTNDFLDYVSETRQLLDKLLTMDNYIKSLKSPVLSIVEERLERLKEVKYGDLLTQMQQLLAATYNAPNHDDFLRNLASLLHIFGGWRRMIQLDDHALDDPEAMEKFVKETQKTINSLTDLTQKFHGFVEARNLADYYIRQAELSLIRMMLSYEGNPEKWWLEYLNARSEEISRFVPEKLDPHQLLIGVTHSLALHEDLEQRLLPQIPNIKTTVGELGVFLQSPALQMYEEINQIRLTLWTEYEKEIVSLLKRLRNGLHHLIKRDQK